MRLSVQFILLSICLFFITYCASAQNPDKSQLTADVQLLSKNDIPADSSSLKSFLLKYLPTAKSELEIKLLIADLASSSFRVRENAAKKLIDKGAIALKQLRAAAMVKDLETKTRAKGCVDAIEKDIEPELHEAAVRVLAIREKSAAAKLLFDYLPFAVSESVGDTVESCLMRMAVGTKQPDLIVGYLQDRNSRRRSMAALLLGSSTAPNMRKRVQALLKDSEALVRVRAAQGLLLAKDTTGIPQLLDILQRGPYDVAERAETILHALAKENGPKLDLAKDKQIRKECRDVWQKWWNATPKQLAWAELKSTLPGSIPGGPVARTAQRFLFALAQGNVAKIENLLDVPFILHPQVTIKDRDQLLQMFRQAAKTSPKVKFKVQTSRTTNLTSYMKQAPKNHRKALAKLPGDTYVYLLRIHDMTRNKQESAVMLLSRQGGRIRIIGILPEK